MEQLYCLNHCNIRSDCHKMLENEVIFKECNKLDFSCFHYELCLIRDYFFIAAN